MNAYIRSKKRTTHRRALRFIALFGLVVAVLGVLLYIAEQIYKAGYSAGLQDGSAVIEHVIQENTKAMSAECDAKIDEILGQF